MNTITSTPYDDVFKTIQYDCPRLIIPLVNEIFGTNYTGNELITFGKNDLFIYETDTSTKEKFTDSCFTIHSTIDKTYHLECQSTSDGSIQVPILKIQLYTLNQIFDKGLLFLIPFYIFCYEKSFPEYNTNEEKLRELESEYIYIKEKLEDLCGKKTITEYQKYTIFRLSEKIIEHIAKKYENVKKGATFIMGGNILDYDAKDILYQGRREGLSEGILKGKSEAIEAFVGLIKDGIFSISEAARRLNMEESELQKYL